jgi:UDP-N-acetylglucosamine--N-acetylmuramyl-(pentapeptide) pyrophosphoryl-undecaprenol N-acetylglucosamine transferase
MIRKIVVTGTHLTPALEFIRQLKQDKINQWQILYIGRNKNSIEAEIIPSNNIKYIGINCGKFDRTKPLKSLTGIPSIFKSIYQCYLIIKKIKPDLVVSFGGHVSVPPVIASYLNKIPSITHEQTPTISLTTKINSYFVTKVALSFDVTKSKKTVITGNLLRHEISQIKANKPKNFIFVTAGNQGSHSINSIIKILLPNLQKYTIYHQTGKKEYKLYKKLEKRYNNYHVFDYIQSKDIGWVLNNSLLMISRSGANTSQEIIALGKKSILIPLPKTQQNEQTLNAQYVKSNLPQHTIIIPQRSLTPQKLLESINYLDKIKKPKVSKLKTNYKLLKLVHEII